MQQEIIETVNPENPNKRKRLVRKVQSVPDPEQPSMTEQHHKKDCDIRHIMRKSQQTGMVTHLAQYEGRYMDLANRPDFERSQQIIADGKTAFETVPADIRDRFHNNPAEWIEFMQNPDNREEMIELGFGDEHLPPDRDWETLFCHQQ